MNEITISERIGTLRRTQAVMPSEETAAAIEELEALVGTGVKKGRHGFWVFITERGQRVSGDFGPYASEVEARRAGPAHKAGWLGTF